MDAVPRLLKQVSLICDGSHLVFSIFLGANQKGPAMRGLFLKKRLMPWGGRRVTPDSAYPMDERLAICEIDIKKHLEYTSKTVRYFLYALLI